MSVVLGIVLLVFFVVVAVLLILLVLVQNEEGDSLGGIFAGGSSTAFGSRSGNVLTRATTVLGALFLMISLGMAVINRSSKGLDERMEHIGSEGVREKTGEWWGESSSIDLSNDLSNDSSDDLFESGITAPDAGEGVPIPVTGE
ncbi:MAG: preprotein translocase subunit SecG [Treponema sp.]|jgi:preprotein translocase subunit SecG|nr:preprotein translocase subunit SecG [Treponema sp.]